MYGAGVLVGLLVDTKGPRPGVLLGGLLLGVGNLVLHRGRVTANGYSHHVKLLTPMAAYESGPGSVTLPWLCFATFLSGLGGASAFYGAMKTSKVVAINSLGEAHSHKLP